MKLSIWQQFSSNHSAAFDIVAQFESAEWAEEVRQLITQVILDYYDWDTKDHLDSDIIDLKNDYELDGFHLELTWILNRQHAQRAVYVVDNLLFISDEPGYAKTAMPSSSLVRLIKSFGGKIGAHFEGLPEGSFSIRADMPSQETIVAIQSQFREQTFSDGKQIISLRLPLTWVRFYPNDFHIDDNTISFNNIWGIKIDRLYSLIRFLKEHDGANIQVKFVVEYDPMEVLKGASIDNWINLDNFDVHRADWSKWIYHQTPKSADIIKFASRKEALTTANNIREMLTQIVDWANNNPEEAQIIWEKFWVHLSPPEEQLKTQYDLDWQYSVLEWARYAHQQGRLHDIIAVYDEYVLLRNTHETVVGIQPFDMFAKQRGIINVYPSGQNDVWFNITIHAPDKETLDMIHDAIANHPPEKVPDWIAYYDGQAQTAEFIDSVQNALDYALLHERLLTEFWDKYGSYRSRYSDKEEQLAAIEFIKSYPIPTRSEHKVEWFKLQEVLLTSYDISHRDDHTLTFQQIKFKKGTTFQGFVSFVYWIRAHGCTIDYMFRSIDSIPINQSDDDKK